jgi:tetratricopeptide (TPR) repeat protein
MTFSEDKSKKITIVKLLELLGRLFDMAFFHATAKILGVRSRFDQLEHFCKRKLQQRPSDYLANYYLARSLRKQGKLNEAVEVYRKILRLPGSKFFLDTFDFLWVLYEAGRYDEIIVAGEDALSKLNSGSLGMESALKDLYLDTVHRVLGGSYAKLGEYEKAIPHLELACKLEKATRPEEVLQLLQQCREQVAR